ncbi:hypothetical protein ACFFV7_30170 [Nonomuraea spiralis]|uniref:Uncharacterized protein n=1 Tax=Nonomuraea spiralis TaxID=46182 RepID=A0ABV5ILR7_9ACTN|nr:hypothetical protein [Nonomuraea spiralis]GGT25929.1 hypothetical protein GCM10010176_083200 [Nonomuraea spiralis]
MFKKLLRFLLIGLAAGSLLATAALYAPASASASPTGARQSVVTVLGYNSTDWKYLQVPPASDAPLFYARNFDDSGWSSGQEGFGTTNGICSWNKAANVKTPWAVNTDILVRHWVHIPRGARQIRIQGTIDNDARVYFNGRLVQAVKSGGCVAGAINVVLPVRGMESCNLLAIRGHDYGVGTYLNVEVSYVRPTPSA